jgi:large subunit ribosomal protein L2
MPSLFKFKPLLIRNQKARKGRNKKGKIIIRARRCGQNNRRTNVIDWRRNLYNTKSRLINVNYLSTDRTGFIGNLFVPPYLIYYNILLPTPCLLGDELSNYQNSKIWLMAKVGDAQQLSNVKLSAKIFNLSKNCRGRGIYSRAAGTYTIPFRFLKISNREYMGVCLPSGQKKYLPGKASCTLGVMSNAQNYKFELGSAGKSFTLGHRPKVRGVAMNPIDHPHGGGEGKTTAGGHPVSLWGKLTKGKKTVRKCKTGTFSLET